MAIAATPKSAVVTGAWTVLGMATFEAWEKKHPVDVTTHYVLFLALSAIFFFGPVMLFVIGPQYIRLDMRLGFQRMLTREYWADFGRVCVRMLCWFLGAGAFGIPY